MRKLYLSFFLIGLFAGSLLQAQKKCGYDYIMAKAHAKGFSDNAFEAAMARLIQQRTENRLLFTGPVTLPVIFHVIYRNGDAEGASFSDNISQANIQAQINQLNADFANLSLSGYGVAANVQIQFCLAQASPAGTPLAQPGIERINGEAQGWDNTGDIISQGTVINYIDDNIKPVTIWDPYRYINIWVIDVSGSNLLGYGTFPSLSAIPDLPSNSGETDLDAGVVLTPGSVGSLSVPGFSAPYNFGRTLTHELGHFLGLRHIWGDVTCGNDFCGDTPVQRDETSGCPTVSGGQFLQNCPNPGDGTQRMFENYMDYSNDGCMNTFTANQASRCQAVMDNSPRRSSLITSNACTPPVANAIAFLTTTTATTEAPAVMTCPRYKEITISLKAAISASGNATVTFTKGGTATDIVDYSISPASVTFTNFDNTTKIITVRINDDALAESAETIILAYTISGSGVVAGAGNQSHTITITDNDLTPVINNNGSIVLLSENFESGTALPLGWSKSSFAAPGNLNVWTISANGGAGITGNAAHITNNTGTNVLNYDVNSESLPFLATPVLATTGAPNPVLTFKYKVNGEIDAGTIYDYGTVLYTLNGTNYFQVTDGVGNPYELQGVLTAATATIPLPAILHNAVFKLAFLWVNDGSFGNQPPFVIDDIVVSTDATRIESTASQPVTENVFSSQDVYLKSAADGQVLARIQNADANIGCLTAVVSQAGTTRVAVNTNTGSYFRTEKVIQLSPAIANTSVTYQGTLYFSAAELQPWVTAGVPLNTLKILKVADGTSLASTLNFSNSAIITPTFSDQSVSGYYAYTGNFTGFSQFMLASPNIALPVQLLAFEASVVRKSIVLNWSTSQELNNRGFGIERSTDGINFDKIGWADGRITTNTRTDYNYTDNYVQPGVTYYYRLRQTDIDAREKLSIIKQAKISLGGISLTVSPNPATDHVNLFISGSGATAEISLLNMQGQLVRKWSQVNASAAPYKLTISGLAGGLYMLQVQLPEQKLVEKVLIR